MSKQSIANQLNWARVTKQNLENLSFTMDNFSKHYMSQVEMLSANNYFQESLNEIRQMAEEFDTETKKIRREIEKSHIAYIDKQSKALINQLSQYAN